MPDWSAEILARLAPLGLGAEREFEIAEELAQHLEQRFAELRARGVSESEASQQARDELHHGSLVDALAHSEPRAPRDNDSPPGSPSAGSHVASLWRDVRYGMRSLRK
ncbi:MAG TPA: permease prefix domain 1-containing protein, partial [Gemmatimonadaceae bacterium]